MSELFDNLGIPVSKFEIKSLCTFLDEIIRFNSMKNLVGTRDTDGIIISHIMDSAAAYPVFMRKVAKGGTIADVGSGAGFPGLVLATLMGDREFTLIDRLPARASFMKASSIKMKLDNVRVITGDVRNVGEKFDAVTTRAFGSIPESADLIFPLVKPSSSAIYYKGSLEKTESEIGQLGAMGYSFESETIPLNVPRLFKERTLAVITRWKKL